MWTLRRICFFNSGCAKKAVIRRQGGLTAHHVPALPNLNGEHILSCTYYLYLCRHSLWAGWVGITNWVDHVSDGGTSGSTVLCELTRHFHSVLSPSCVAEDSRSGVSSFSRNPRLICFPKISHQTVFSGTIPPENELTVAMCRAIRVCPRGKSFFYKFKIIDTPCFVLYYRTKKMHFA